MPLPPAAADPDNHRHAAPPVHVIRPDLRRRWEQDQPFDRNMIENLSVKPLIVKKTIDKDPDPQIEEEQVKEEGVKEKESRDDVAESESELEKEAWGYLRKAVVNCCGSAVGTVAADYPATASSPLNYYQVFIRDLVPLALAFLMKGRPR